jgi:hypothetical protein
MDTLQQWVTQALKYPVMEIYGGKDLAQTKEEKRVIKVCEDIFKLSASTPSESLPRVEMSVAWRDLEVALKLTTTVPVKPEYIQEQKEKFLQSAKEFIILLETTYKKEQVLKVYYESWKLKYQEVKELVYHL